MIITIKEEKPNVFVLTYVQCIYLYITQPKKTHQKWKQQGKKQIIKLLSGKEQKNEDLSLEGQRLYGIWIKLFKTLKLLDFVSK